jgi:hypothetical protein
MHVFLIIDDVSFPWLLGIGAFIMSPGKVHSSQLLIYHVTC